MENGLEKDKIEVILVRGGGVYTAVVEIEIREWIPEIFKGMTARLVWEKGTDEGEEIENDTHISGFGNWLNGRNNSWHREEQVGRQKQVSLEQVSLKSVKCL